MIELIFKCHKCKKKESIKNANKETRQPFCMDCCRPMFLDKAINKQIKL